MSVTPYNALRYIIACIMPSEASPTRLSAVRRSRWYSAVAAVPASGTGLNPARDHGAEDLRQTGRAVPAPVDRHARGGVVDAHARHAGQGAHGLFDAARAARAVHAFDQEHDVLVFARIERPARVQCVDRAHGSTPGLRDCARAFEAIRRPPSNCARSAHCPAASSQRHAPAAARQRRAGAAILVRAPRACRCSTRSRPASAPLANSRLQRRADRAGALRSVAEH